MGPYNFLRETPRQLTTAGSRRKADVKGQTVCDGRSRNGTVEVPLLKLDTALFFTTVIPFLL